MQSRSSCKLNLTRKDLQYGTCTRKDLLSEISTETYNAVEELKSDWKIKMHPSFKKKPVVQLVCRFCNSCICKRGMKAVLLADTDMELYSTDAPCVGKISNVGRPYSTGKCECKISDTACNHCGNNVGYTILIPCVPCLQSCNNGHLWIFNSTVVWAEGKLDKSGSDVLRWDSLPECPDDDNSQDSFLEDMDDIECIR